METNDNNRLTPSRAIHPGEILRDELEAREIKQKDFAQSIGMRPSHLNDIINGRRNITEKIAKKLEIALGIPYESWMRLHYFYLHDLKSIAQSNINKNPQSIANILNKALARQGISARQVADIIGISEEQIKTYTNGSDYPSLKIAGSLCLVLGIAPSTMLGL